MAHTAVGTVIAVGRMIYPSLRENGYNERFSVGLIASSGAIAVVIPPSIAMILYSVSAQQSAVALFTAGILPSLLIGLIDAVYVMGYAWAKRLPLTARARWEAIWATTKEASWSLGTIVVIFGGIYGGVFTPTEAAGVAVIYSLFVTMVVHREVDLGKLWSIIQSSVFLIAQILMIVTVAGLYSWLLTTSGMPQAIVAHVAVAAPAALGAAAVHQHHPADHGQLPEPPAAILILTPLLLPLIQAIGMSPIHFGIVMTVNLSIGMYNAAVRAGREPGSWSQKAQTPLANIRRVPPLLRSTFIGLMLITRTAISPARLCSPARRVGGASAVHSGDRPLLALLGRKAEEQGPGGVPAQGRASPSAGQGELLNVGWSKAGHPALHAVSISDDPTRTSASETRLCATLLRNDRNGQMLMADRTAAGGAVSDTGRISERKREMPAGRIVVAVLLGWVCVVMRHGPIARAPTGRAGQRTSVRRRRRPSREARRSEMAAYPAAEEGLLQGVLPGPAVAGGPVHSAAQAPRCFVAVHCRRRP